MPDLTRDELARLARVGAEARLAQLDMEASAIKAAFPDLVPGRNAGRPAVGRTREAAAAPKDRKPYRMSPANRKAAADRMKAYWAKKRAAKQVAEAHDKPSRTRRRGRKRGRTARH